MIGSGPDAVTVTVTEIRGGKARLGIEANPDIPVDRCEVRSKPSYTPEYRRKGGPL